MLGGFGTAAGTGESTGVLRAGTEVIVASLLSMLGGSGSLGIMTASGTESVTESKSARCADGAAPTRMLGGSGILGIRTASGAASIDDVEGGAAVVSSGMSGGTGSFRARTSAATMMSVVGLQRLSSTTAGGVAPGAGSIVVTFADSDGFAAVGLAVASGVEVISWNTSAGSDVVFAASERSGDGSVSVVGFSAAETGGGSR